MKHALRKTLAWFLALMMLASALPLNILAEGSTPAEEAIPSSAPTTEEGTTEVPAEGQPSEDEIPAETQSLFSVTSVVPSEDNYRTYIFWVDESIVAQQTVKEGETLLRPATPAKEGYLFDGWKDGKDGSGNPFEGFGVVTGITQTETVNIYASFRDVFYVFFKDNSGRIVATKSGKTGDVISTADVTFPVEATQAVTGWLLDGAAVDSVTLDASDVTLTARVEDGYWITFESNEGSYVAPAFYANSQTAAAPAAPQRPGYSFVGWFTDVELQSAADFGAITANTTLYAKWTAGSASYTVIHFQENADDDGYSYVESETKSGTVGSQTSAAARSYNGFTAQTITQAVIAGDGSTIVNVYYKRNVYEVKFYKGDRWSGWSEITGKRITAKYGANISAKWPGGTWKTSAGGNVFQANIDVMPLGGTSFYETEQGNGSAYYYLEDLNGKYVLDHTDSGASRSSTVTKEDRYPITGFTCNTSRSAKDGSRYSGAEFYYYRNSYKVVFISNGTEVNTMTFKYQADISSAGGYTLSSSQAPAGKEGYYFDGWYLDPEGSNPYSFSGKTMPAQNITVYAKWSTPVHTVTFYKEDNVSVVGTVERIPHGTAMDGASVPTYTPAEGYEFLGWVTANGAPFNFSTEIRQDYSLYAKVRKTGSVRVIYDANGGSGDAPVDSGAYAEGSYAKILGQGSLVAPAGKPAFLGWSTDADAAAPQYVPGDMLPMGTADVTLYAVWGVKEGTVSLTYHSNFGTDQSSTVTGLANNGLVTVKGYGETGLPARAGYTFQGWSTAPAGSVTFGAGSSARVNADGSNDLYAVWAANTNTEYTVEFYYMNADGTSYPSPPNHAETRTGTTDTTVSVTAADKADKENGKYTYDAAAGNVESATLLPEGTVLKLYFKLNVAQYTIHHYLEGTTISVADDQTGELIIGNELTAAKSGDLYSEYADATVARYAPAQSITIGISGNVITVYYKVPLTLTAGDANKVYDGTPLTQPEFTAEGLVNEDKVTLAMTAESTITNVGSQPNVIDQATVKVNGGAIPGYYTVAYQPGTLTVTQAEKAVVTIQGNTDTKVYNGTEQTVTGYAVTSNPANAVITLAEGKAAAASGTNVGKYNMGLTAADFTATSPNYKQVEVQYTDGWLEIIPDPNEIVVTIIGNTDSKVYNAAEQSVTGFTTDVGTKTIDVALKDGAKAEAKGTDVGEYPMGLTADNFSVTSKNYSNIKVVVVDGQLKITPVTDEVVVTITGSTDTKVYNAAEQSVTGYTTDVGTKTINVALKEGAKAEAKGTNVGKYPMGLTADNFSVTSKNYSNIKVVVNDGWLKITPITDEVIVTITGNTDTKVYNGSEQSVTGFTTDVGDKDIHVALKEGHVTEAKGIDSNTYYMGLTAADFTVTSDNYSNITVVVSDGWLEITPITDEVTVTITGNTDTKVYNAAEQSVTGFTTDVGTKTIDVALAEAAKAEAKGTNVGEYPMGLTADIFIVTSRNYSNIKVVVVDGWLKITPTTEEVIVTITGNKDTKVYNAAEQSVTGYTTDVGTKTIDVALKEGMKAEAKGTDVGTYYMGLTAECFSVTSENYANIKVVVNDGRLEITPITDEVVVTITGNTDTRVYNAAEQSVTGYTTDVGTKTIDVKLAEGMKAEAKGTDVGKYPMGLSKESFIVESRNYSNVTVVVEDGWLEITPITDEVVVNITGNTDTKVYNAAEQSVTGYTTDVGDKTIDVELAEGAKAEAKGTDVGTYNMGLTADSFSVTSRNYSNIKVVVVDGWLEITPITDEVKVTITGNTDTRVYNTTEQSVTGYTTDVGDKTIDVELAEGAKAEAKGTDVGEYPMGLTADSFIVTSRNYSNIKVVVVDGWLKITPITEVVVVNITGNTGTKVYNASEQSVTGYTTDVGDKTIDVALKEGLKAEAKGTDVDIYYMGLKEESFSVTSKNYSNIEVAVKDGWLEITPITDEVVVTITGNTDTKVYNAAEQSVTGYTTDVGDKTIDVELVEGMKAEAKGTYVGKYYMGLSKESFIVESRNYSNVTVVVEDGWLEITPITDEIVVTITGNTGSFHYDKAEHTVTGYTVKISDPRYTEDDFGFSGTASVSGIEPGDYLMGLKAEDFENVNENFTNVKFVVKDGWLNIFTEKFRVAWLYDTNQMINSDEASDKFSAITKFIERNDMRLVLHTGNVVDNAADEGQWKVFNDAMEKIYAVPHTDTLMVSGEKETEEGSLFLQQPIWDEFEEEDLFEGGKGFVYRFHIGQRRMILVGLGEDAMTEEGYKWAKERFDSDPYAAGILMVHTYLLDDMTKEQKIADSALELEEKVVKACSNVHMVFSSNAGYASHYSFFYGNRKTTAINVDIEAAAKEGYFTMLTFDADMHSLSVTSVSPIKNDWIYNEEKFDLECYDVLGVY